MRVAIIGGGIGGLAAALSLRRAGFEVEVFEQAPELLDIGAAIAVWPNAMRVLQNLGLGEEILKHAGVIEHVQWLEHDGRLLKHFKLPQTPAPAVALHRADLQHVLQRAIPGQLLHLGSHFEGFEQFPQEKRIAARFADGSLVECELLIGADGLHSRTREQLLGDGQPVYRGYTVWRGITERTPDALPPLTAMELYGRGQRFGIGPVGAGRTGWWATVNEDERAADTMAERQRKLLDHFADWYAPVRELIEGTPARAILRNPAYDRAPVGRWSEGRVTLLGDAAHPMTPNLGQGGCMAIEDGSVLARCLLKHGERVESALRVYERLRHARTSAVTRYSLRYGAVGQWEGGAATKMRSKLLGMLPVALGRKLLRLLFDYDAEGVAV